MVGLINMHLPERWGFVRFIASARPPEGEGDGEEADGRTMAQREAGEEEWVAREVAMASHYLLQDWLVAHKTLPPSLEALGLGGEVAGLGGCRWEGQAAGDLPGGYRVSVGRSDGRRVCVRGDAKLWIE